ncbi:PTS sugar transporter subunit IIA [Luteimicrobium subarcticum]|uniref:PTS system N-acetylglucosamine-specific IIA component (Glc family) n=1 Tax=Luteimicrobium subarcticum TaxID=620910 RepID=A0A2M8W773_9MICO|nr:PTS glucose transporter subunit IIA [Luteimicrobium subarcticum]PJI86778.1 PTS system N-acetylglucosamine-specific IIA component (Glc family) [Luteimicrobium subarcticum]
MTTTVVSPLSGTVRELADVDDPVFSAALVGPGVALDPGDVEKAVAVAPVAGTIAKLHPHAFVVTTPEGKGVLVHLGIDTVQLQGEGFTLHAAEGDDVQVGQELVTWSPRDIVAGGRSAICPVVVLDQKPDALTRVAQAGEVVAGGEDLYTVE